MQPLLSYYGGKQRIASKILPYFPHHTVYCEPFCGGATMLFKKPIPPHTNNDHYREIINDTSDLLINFYRVAIKQPEALQLEIDGTLYSKSNHIKALGICKHPELYDSLTLAWAYYVNLQMSFANELNRGWGTGVMGRNLAATFNNKKQRLKAGLERLAKVHVEKRDALQVIATWDSPQTLFYCDPPYPNAYQGHYKGYTLDNWRSLCDALDNAQGSYVLSGYDCEVEPKSTQQKIEIKAVCSASGKGQVGNNRDKSKAATNLGKRNRMECLWVCDRSDTVRDSLKPILNKMFDIV